MEYVENRQHVIEVTDAFCDRNITEERVVQWIRSGGVPRAVYEDFYDSELGSYCLPPNLGGRDCPFSERALVVERLMRRAGATLPVLSDMIAMALLSTMRFASQQEIVEDFLSRSGRVSFSQAFSEEGAGSNPADVCTSVSREGEEILLNGEKTFVSNGQFASDTLVLTRDPLFGGVDGGLSLWLVPLSSPGISTFPLSALGQEMLSPAIIQFSQVPLNPDWRIQSEGKLSFMLKRQYELGRVLVCASSLGLARAAMDDALERAATHQVKGRRLGSLPQIQEKLTDMEVALRSMEALVYGAAHDVYLDRQKTHLSCALMKRFVPKAATEVASEALQIMGGVGYTDAERVGRIWRDCRGNQIAQGTDEVMVGPAAKQLMAERGL